MYGKIGDTSINLLSFPAFFEENLVVGEIVDLGFALNETGDLHCDWDGGRKRRDCALVDLNFGP